MQLILKLFFLIFLFLISFTTLSANELEQNSEQDTKIYFKYGEDKKNINLYRNQIFKVNLSLLVFNDKYFKITSKLSNYTGVKILDDDISWEYQGKNKWTSSLYFKAIYNNIKLPDINVSIDIDNQSSHKTIMQGYRSKTRSLNWLRNSSKILANELDILDYTSKIYNKSHNILLITMKAKYANLEDIYINNKEIIGQGMKDLKFNYPWSDGVYYAIIPNYIKTFTFNYFNLNDKKFKDIEIFINASNDSNFLISDIDPESKLYEKYKLFFLILIIFLSLFLSFYRQKLSYIFIAVFLIIVLISQFVINEKGIMKKGSKLRVLPIKNSTIFYVSSQEENVKILKRNEKFVKIELNNKIGWVNEKYITKN